MVIAWLYAGLAQGAPNRVGVAPKLEADPLQGQAPRVQRGGLSDLGPGEGKASARDALPFEHHGHRLAVDTDRRANR